MHYRCNLCRPKTFLILSFDLNNGHIHRQFIHKRDCPVKTTPLRSLSNLALDIISAWLKLNLRSINILYADCAEKCDAKATELGEETGGKKEQEERGKTEKETEPAR